MRDRLSEWQLHQAESAAIPGVDDFMEQLAAEESTSKRDQEAVYFAAREDHPSCGYDLAETVNRRRAIKQEAKLSYAKIKHGMKFSAAMGVSFELAKGFMASDALTWFLEIAPRLVLNGSISVDVYYQLSFFILGVNATRTDIDKMTAAIIIKVGLFKGDLTVNDGQLVAQYRGRAKNFKEFNPAK